MPARAHPRSRGENRQILRRFWVAGGSSPLTRGKPFLYARSRSDLGLIPAHAGKTITSTPSHPTLRAHPRSRGENWSNLARSAGEMGSSPLTRGKPFDFRAFALQEGLIPAHAGKTTLRRLRAYLSRAHPRSRGENPPTDESTNRPSGSSPLTRGKLPEGRR